jgi:hypothetical protein
MIRKTSLVLVVLAVWLVSCRAKVKVRECEPGMAYCEGEIAHACRSDGQSYEQTDCRLEDKVCHDGPGCVLCTPGTFVCDGQSVAQCRPDGSGADVMGECDVDGGLVCYLGACTDACAAAAEQRSYIGCEYYTVDLDNAMITQTFNAARQQYAVAISNVGLVEAHVTVYRNDAPVGWPLEETVVSEADVLPDGLHVFTLPGREVDGSHDGVWDNGTHTHLSSNAYRIVSNVPIVAYQFNPLENVQVFSNDASILVPTSALDTQYMVMGWPQTIADTDDPDTDFNKNLRVFLTIVGTEPGTDVTIKLTTDIVGSPDIPPYRAGDTFEVVLGPYDVLNLETGSFNADFTGTEVSADKPVAVFSGSEASDVPYFDRLDDRYCCADHLEHQMMPESAAGTEFVAALTPPRTPAVEAAGGTVTVVDEPGFFRILALHDDTVVQTTLGPPHDQILLNRGEHRTIEAFCDFVIRSSLPIFVGQFIPGQALTGIAPDLPGGDPAFLILPPVEQWRMRYVFLTPDKYAFDFMVVVAPEHTNITFDLVPMPDVCTYQRAECPGHPDPTTSMMVYRCQLSFPEIIEGLPPPDNIIPGDQNDGYHILEADEPIEVILFGFDKHVSYIYMGGTDAKRINVE